MRLNLKYMCWGLAALAAVAVAFIVTIVIPTPGRAASVPLSISISGNHFVNGSGQTIRLLGVNTPSSEYACEEGFGYDDGGFTAADAAAIASWHADAVRIPLNEDCWLGINGEPNTGAGHPELTAAGYRQDIESYVQALNDQGIYVILDLHWSAPGSQVADSQQPMPDAHSTDFWTSVATTFKSNPAVVFDLFNEPFDPTNPESGSDTNPADAVSWQCWDQGGCVTQSYVDQSSPTGIRYTVVGMQALVTAIRSIGATQPIMIGGLNYANDLSQWSAYAPVDPLNQEAASFHNYLGQVCDTQSCWDSTIAPIAANVPVVTGEFDEDDFDESTCKETDSQFDDTYMNWADQHGVSYLAWGWYVLDQSEEDSAGCSAYFLINDYDNGVPAAPNGTALHDHLAALASSTPTTTTPTSASTSTTSPSNPPSTTSTATVPRTPTVAPAPTLKSFKATVKSRGVAVSFLLRSTQSCSGVLTGLTTSSFVTGIHHRRARVSLGTVHFSLRAGAVKAIVLKLSQPARTLLHRHRTLRVLITVTLTNSTRYQRVSRHVLTLVRPRA